MTGLEWARLWMFIRPVKRIRRALRQRRMGSWVEEHGGPPDEVLEEFNSEQEIVMNELWKSHGRSALKVVGAVIAALGVADVGDVDVVMQALESVIGGAMVIYAVVKSHYTHA